MLFNKLIIFFLYFNLFYSTETEPVLIIEDNNNIKEINDLPSSSSSSSKSSTSTWNPSDLMNHFISPFSHSPFHSPFHNPLHFNSPFHNPFHNYNYNSLFHTPYELYSHLNSLYNHQLQSKINSNNNNNNNNKNNFNIDFNAPMDVKENEKGYDISIELPGIKKDEISITVKNNIMTISGERKLEEIKDNEKYHRVERYYGKSSRSFTLPPHIHKDDVKASYIDGILHLNIPKKDETCKDEIKVDII